MWVPLYFVRRFFYVGVLVLMLNYPLYQLIICVIKTLVVLACIIIVRPFEKRISNIVNFFNELVILTAFSVSFFF